jgi:hypothetical protein
MNVEGTYRYWRAVRFPMEALNEPVKRLDDRFLKK